MEPLTPPAPAESLARLWHEQLVDIAPAADLLGWDSYTWAELPPAVQQRLVAVADHVLRSRLADLALVYGYEVGRVGRDGVCGARPPAHPRLSTINSACALRPEHLGLHENDHGLRWGEGADGVMVIDSSPRSLRLVKAPHT